MSGKWSSRARAILLLLAARLLLGAGAFAADDDAGALCGRVTDGSGAPVPSAAVVVEELGIEARTGSDGRYEIKGIPAGSYAVEARAGGYSIDAAEAIEILPGATSEVDFRLIALEVPLREIVVTSSVSIFSEVPASAASLDRDQITALPHFGDDPYRAIAVLPGTSGGDISGRFNVRGGFHDELLVRLDEMELYEPFHLKDFQGVFSVLDPEMIDSVELVPGAFTSEYGDRMTGVLNITSRRPTESHGNLGISFTNAWASSGGSFSNGKGRWLGSLRRGYLDLVLDRVGDDDEDPPDPRYWDAFGALGYDPSPRHALALQVLLADDDLLFEEEEPDEVVDAVTGYGSSSLWLRHQAVVAARAFVISTLYGGRVTVDRDLYWLDRGDIDETFDIDDVRELDLYGLRQDWQLELSRRNYLRWGFELRSYDVGFDYESSSLIDDSIDDPRFEPGIRVQSFHDSYQGEWYSGYVSDRLGLGRRVTAELGVRYDRQTLTDESDISPRANLLFNVAANGVVRVGWGEFHQSQRPYELAVQFGETEFYESQRAEHWTVGYEGDLSRALTIRADAYLRNVANPHPRWETLFDPFNPVPEIATDLVRLAPESVSARGVEVYVTSRSTSSFSWWLAYTWSSVEDLLDGVDTPRFVDQTHALTASASWRPGPKWTLTGVWTYHTGWPTTAVSAELVPGPGGDWVLTYDIGPFYQERLDDYYRLDVRASRSTSVGRNGRLTFFVDVQNLTNRDNLRGYAIADPEYSYDPQTGDYEIAFPEEHWLPIIPSFGVSWEF
jgi:hypothetical protein